MITRMRDDVISWRAAVIDPAHRYVTEIVIYIILSFSSDTSVDFE